MSLPAGRPAVRVNRDRCGRTWQNTMGAPHSKMNDDGRKDPEAFLDLVPQARKGRLKVYLGGAAGVGKTYRMLEEAHQLCSEGHDAVLGLIEPHQRKETIA